MPPEPGWRAWIAPLLLLASAACVGATLTLEVLVAPATGGANPVGAGLAHAAAVTCGVAAAALLGSGVVLALRWTRGETPSCVGWFTAVLFVSAVLWALPMLFCEWVIATSSSGGPDSPVPGLRWAQAAIGAHAAALLVGAALRWARSRLAPAWTASLACSSVPFFPFGTAVGVIWFAFVRPRETRPSGPPSRPVAQMRVSPAPDGPGGPCAPM